MIKNDFIKDIMIDWCESRYLLLIWKDLAFQA